MPVISPRPALPVIMGPDGKLHVGAAGMIRIDPTEAAFVQAVVSDLGRLAELPEGDHVLGDCDRLGRPVSIERPKVPTDPPNAWIEPVELAVAGAGDGTGCGSRITYNPTDWPRKGDPGLPTGEALLLALLRQANIYAAGAADPTDPGPCIAT